jgi:hypothetical protein
MKVKAIGADPEYLVTSNGEPYPVIGLIGGSKYEPIDLGNGYFGQEDNVLAEGNIPPAYSEKEFVNNMITLQEKLNDFINKHGNFSLVNTNSAEFKHYYLEHPQAQAFGCNPHSNAWDQNSVILSPEQFSDIRTVGCHIHVGLDTDELKSFDIDPDYVIVALVRYMDLYLGIPSKVVQFDKYRDPLYGELGSYRIKPYGFEYRVLGGYFAGKDYLEWIYNRTIECVSSINTRKDITNILKTTIDKSVYEDNKLYEELNINFKNQIKYVWNMGIQWANK